MIRSVPTPVLIFSKTLSLSISAMFSSCFGVLESSEICAYFMHALSHVTTKLIFDVILKAQARLENSGTRLGNTERDWGIAERDWGMAERDWGMAERDWGIAGIARIAERGVCCGGCWIVLY